MKRIILFLLLLAGMTGYGQVILTTNNVQTVTNKTFDGGNNTFTNIAQISVVDLPDSLAVLRTLAEAGGSGGGWAVTGTTTLTGAATIDLDGNTLSFQQGGNNFISIDPSSGSESALLQSINTTDGWNVGNLSAYTTNTQGNFALQADFNDNTKHAQIAGYANVTESEITYTADTHVFSGNFKSGSANAWDLDGNTLSVQQGGNNLLELDPTGFTSTLTATDGTAQSLVRVVGDLVGNNVSFEINANDGSSEVSVSGNGQASTLTYTADSHTFNGIINNNVGSSGTYNIADGDGHTFFNISPAANSVQIGDINNISTLGASYFDMGPGLFRLYEFSSLGLELGYENTSVVFYAGDVDNNVNATSLIVNDDQMRISLLSLNGDIIVTAASNIALTAVHFNYAGLQDFANNAAAITGGLVAGDLYYTRTVDETVVKIVVTPL